MRKFAFLLALLPLAACTGNTPAPVATPEPLPAPPPVSGPGRVLAYWTQFGPHGGREIRAVMSGSECPSLATEHASLPLEERAPATGAFPLVCSSYIPGGTADIELVTANTPADHLPLPKFETDPQRILVIGDTGCRLKGSLVQRCNDERQWPFPNIARKAADLKPDLVIHVGDYLYRENACPANEAGCQGTPFGDNWPTWAADFFSPAQPLLTSVPWVFVRGNHEDCQRAGPGWMRLLEAGRYNPEKPCADHMPPFGVPLKDMTLVVMDNASAPDTTVDANAVPVYRDELAQISALKEPVWALLHRPIWAAVSGPLGIPIGGNATEIRAAGENGIGKPVELLISGHIHTFEAINYVDHKVPPQILAGGGGDTLDRTPVDLAGTIFQGSSGVSVKDGLSINGFSYILMTKAANGWSIDVYGQDGVAIRRCMFAGGRVDCPAPKT
jgi:hypothetical protein